jgi:hypothetical protein
MEPIAIAQACEATRRRRPPLEARHIDSPPWRQTYGRILRWALLVVAFTTAPGSLNGQASDSTVSGSHRVSAGRMVLFGGLGLGIGAGLGALYGGAGHPGLGHKCCDIPPPLEYIVEFALVGAVAGAIIGAVTSPRQGRIVVAPYVMRAKGQGSINRTAVAWGVRVTLRL